MIQLIRQIQGVRQLASALSSATNGHADAAARALVTIAVMLLAAGPLEAATYYVSGGGADSSPGSLQQPFFTIRRGLQALKPGDTLLIRAGTYREQLVENDFGSSGTASAWITVAAYPSETVTFNNPGWPEVIRFQDGSKHHIEFKDLIIDGGAVSAGSGIYLASYPVAFPSHDLKFTNVEIKDSWFNGLFGGGSNHQFINLRIHGNGRVPPEVYGPGANGVYFTGDNATFIGGEYYDNLCYGIRIVDSDAGHRASDNLVTRVRSYNNGAGQGLRGTSRCGSSGGGLVVGDTRNIVANNLIYNNTVGIDVMGLSGKAAQNVSVYQNTIYSNKSYAIGVGLFAGASSTDIKNNILWANGSTITNYSDSGTVTAGNTTSNPKFVDPANGDFGLQSGSIAIDTGVALSAVTDDFRGQARPQGSAYDVGAVEFGAGGGPAPPPALRVLITK